MGDIIHWDQSGTATRIAVVELCGWKNRSGHATPTGKRIARTAWDALTLGAQRVLTQHGIVK